MNVAAVPEEQGTRLRILYAAARLFRVRGYADTSLRSIAAAAGIKAGSLYNHFGSKEEIVTEILDMGVRSAFDRVRRAVEEDGGSASGLDLLRLAILAHLTALLGDDNFTSANIRIFAHVPPQIRDATLPLRHEYEAYWSGLLQRCLAEAGPKRRFDPKPLSMYLFGAMNWTLEWYRSDRHSIERIADDLARLFFAGAFSPGTGERAG